jgi:hypothetical protein
LPDTPEDPENPFGVKKYDNELVINNNYIA